MTETMCTQFYEEAENWLAGRRRPAFAEHLASCQYCRGVLADWEKINAAARQMALSQPEPPPQIWNLLEAQLRKEGIIAPRTSRPRTWQATPGRFAWHAVFGVAYAVMLLVAGMLVSTDMRKSPEMASTRELPPIQSWYEPDPEITATLHQDLTMVDNNISLCEKTVREEPQSELARDYLNDAYQQRASLLASMVERGVSLQ
jgi:hypothetical protein